MAGNSWNGYKRPKNACICWTWLKMAIHGKNGWKRLEIARHGWKWPAIKGNG